MEPHRTLDKSHLARALTAESHLLRTVPLTKNSPTYPLPHLSFPIARGVPHPVHAYRACLTGASSWRILQLTPISPRCASLDGSARCLRHSDAATLRPLGSDMPVPDVHSAVVGCCPLAVRVAWRWG